MAEVEKGTGKQSASYFQTFSKAMNTIISIFLAFAFCVPSIGVTMPLYKCEGTTAQKQAIIDAEDSALYCRYSRGHQVGDHVGSIHDDAVWDVSLISIGDVAILYAEDGAEYYECTAIYKVKRGQYYYHRGKAITVDPHDIIALSCVEGEDGYEYCAYFDYKFTG